MRKTKQIMKMLFIEITSVASAALLIREMANTSSAYDGKLYIQVDQKLATTDGSQNTHPSEEYNKPVSSKPSAYYYSGTLPFSRPKCDYYGMPASLSKQLW
jgi:hypothetical protein